MPGLNRKGPEGQGPMTGRKMGRCTNFGESLKDRDLKDSPEADNFERKGSGRGSGRRWRNGGGRGRGRGFGNRHRFHSGE